MAEYASDIIDYNELNNKLNTYGDITDFTKKELDDLLELCRQYADSETNLGAWIELGPGESDDPRPQNSGSEKKTRGDLAKFVARKRRSIEEHETVSLPCRKARKQVQSDDVKSRLDDETARALGSERKTRRNPEKFAVMKRRRPQTEELFHVKMEENPALGASRHCSSVLQSVVETVTVAYSQARKLVLGDDNADDEVMFDRAPETARALESEKKTRENLAKAVAGKKDRIEKWTDELLESVKQGHVIDFITEKLEENPSEVETVTVAYAKARKQVQSDEVKSRLDNETARALHNCLSLKPNL